MGTDVTTREILRTFKRIAVVGISNDPRRASNGVARYLLKNGYDIVPVNPLITDFEGIPAWPHLEAIDGPVDIVNIFRRPEHVPAVVDEAIRIGAKVIWMQQGVIQHEAAATASAAGLHVIMDTCILQEHLAQRWD
jgi:predicted CoA-binding protein